MTEHDTYLFYTLSDDEYTNKYSIDISTSDKIFKNAIMSRSHPIMYRDIMPGNFLISESPTRLFKVITVTDSYLTVAHENNIKKVFYEGGVSGVSGVPLEPLICISPELKIAFRHKVSIKDLILVVKRIKECVAEYNRLSDTIQRMDSEISIRSMASMSELHSVSAPHAKINVYEKHIQENIEPAVVVRKPRKLHWVIRLMTCMW